MADVAGGLEALRLVDRRGEFLAALAADRRHKRDLVADLDVSRSTANRAVRELETAGLVERTDGGYAATLSGRLLVELYRGFLARAGDVLGALDVLAALPPDAPVEEAVLVDADVERVRGPRPFDLPAAVAEPIETADRLRVVLPGVALPGAFERCHERVVREGVDLDLATTPTVFEGLTDRYPDRLAELAAAGCGLWVGDLPRFGLLVARRGDETTVALATYSVHGALQGVVRNDTPAAVEWAERTWDRTVAGAREASDEVRGQTPAGPAAPREDRSARLEAEGFVRPEGPFDGRAPPPPATGWRTGFDLPAVAAGHTVRRRPPEGAGDACASGDDAGGSGNGNGDAGASGDDAGGNAAGASGDETGDLAGSLVGRLRDGRDQALVGPHGSGKSTVCRQVASRWDGPVFYRPSGDGLPFSSWPVLAERLRAADDPALVVVEDAPRPEASAVFRLLREFRDDDGVVFLLDARESEWDDPPAAPVDAGLEACRRAVETVEMPGLDEREVVRFVERFAETTGHAVERDPADLLAAVRGPDAPSGGAAPDELVLLTHRLSLYADPPPGDGEPTTLDEDVRAVYEDLREAGDVALGAGVLVNLLNAAGLPVAPSLVHALGRGDEDRHAAVALALDTLEGRVLFPDEDGGDDGDDGDGGGEGGYRTVHESWSVQFLRHLLAAAGEREAGRRFGRVATALLALADDATLREHAARDVAGAASALGRIAAAPGAWADGTVERLFAVGLERPGLAPLFGTVDRPTVDLPEACSPLMALRCAEWRGRMYLQSDLDRAAAEFEAVVERAGGREGADALAARARKHLGTVANERGDLETAGEHYEWALDRYRGLGDRHGEAQCLNNLGTLEHVRGDLETAREHYERAIGIYRDLGVRGDRADALNNLALIARERGELSTAASHLSEARDVYRELGDRRDEADALVNLGEVARLRGDPETAERCARRALEAYRAIGHRRGEAHAFDNLGRVALLRGALGDAGAHARRSLGIYEDVEDRWHAAACRVLLGRVARERGDPEAAAERFRAALSTYRDLDDSQGEARCRVALGWVDVERGDPAAAVERATRALELSREAGGERGPALARRLLGTAERRRGRLDAATDHLDRALDVARSGGYRPDEAACLADRGHLALARGDREAARERFRAAADLYREVGATRRAVTALVDSAEACEAGGDHDAALAACEEALALADDAGFDDLRDDLERRRGRLAD